MVVNRVLRHQWVSLMANSAPVITFSTPSPCYATMWWLFPCLRGFLEIVLTIHSPPVLFFFFKAEIRSCTLIPLLRPGSVYSGSARWDDCGQMFPDELCASSFPDRFPHCDRGIISPLHLCWVKGVCVFRCNLPPAFFTEWPGSFSCHCGNTGGGTDTK